VEFEIVSRGTAEEKERDYHQERNRHHDEQRQESVVEILVDVLPRRRRSLQRRRVQQGIASGAQMGHRDCGLSQANGQFGIGAPQKMRLGFHSKLTWLPLSRNRRWLDFDHSRWNEPGTERSARETACGPLGVLGLQLDCGCNLAENGVPRLLRCFPPDGS